MKAIIFILVFVIIIYGIIKLFRKYFGAAAHSLEWTLSLKNGKAVFLVSLFTIIVMFLLVFLAPQLSYDGTSLYDAGNSSDKIKETTLIGIFTQNQLPIDLTGKPVANFLLIVSLLGWLIFTGIMGALFNNYIIGMRMRFMEGKARYKMRNHIVVFGANSLLQATMKTLLNSDDNPTQQTSNILVKWWKKWRGDGKVIIVSSKKTQTVLRSLNDFLPLQSDIVVYNIDLADKEILQDLNIEKAKNIYILGDEEPKLSDMQNARLARLIKENIIPEVKPPHRIKCFISVYDERYLHANMREALPNECLAIRPFFHAELAIANVWGAGCLRNIINREKPTENDSDSQTPYNDKLFGLIKPKHFAIIGETDLAKILVKSILSLAHFGPEENKDITIVAVNKRKEEMFYDNKWLKSIEDVNITIKQEEEFLEDLEQATDNIIYDYFIIATSNADGDKLWIDYLGRRIGDKPMLCYTEANHSLHDNISSTYRPQTRYWGFLDERDIFSIESFLFKHGEMLYSAWEEKQVTPFEKLPISAQNAWIDFANYFYNLLLSCSITISSNANEVDILKSKENLIHNAIKKYCAAQKVLHEYDKKTGHSQMSVAEA